jgi:hypothetical protein
MAKIDLDILETVSRTNNWEKFWTRYQGMLDDTDDIGKHKERAREIFDGYQTDPSVFKRGKDKKWSSGGGATIEGMPGGGGNFFQRALNTQMRAKEGALGEFGSLQEGLGILFDPSGKLKSGRDILAQIGGILENEVLVYLDQQSKLLTKINEQTGMTGKLSEAFREEIMKASPDAIRLGITFEELSTTIANVVTQSGKFKLLGADTIKEMALASKFTEDMKTYGDMVQGFAKAGIGARDMALAVERMGLKSMTLGINARETTKIINEQLGKLNQYGFKQGVDGLNQMAQRSIEFRMNMNEAFKLADKVWSPEGALEVVSNLQVIGGAFGDLNDPIKLMYMATNNVEGLQDALIGAAKSLVTYNDEQGRFQITGANLRRARAMAEELGVSLDELTNSAVAAMERTSAASDLVSSGLVMKDEDKEFLTNLAQMKGGKMVIEVPESLQDQLGNQTEVALESMTEEQAKLLLAQKDAFEKMSMEDVARQQVTLVENIERDVSFLRAVARVNVGQEIGNAIEKMLGVNQRVLSEESKKLTNKVASEITEGTEGFSTLMEKAEALVGNKFQIGNLETGAKATKLKNEEVVSKGEKITETAPAETVTRNFVELNVRSSDAVVNDFYRAMWRDPKWMDDFKKGFLNPYSN